VDEPVLNKAEIVEALVWLKEEGLATLHVGVLEALGHTQLVLLPPRRGWRRCWSDP
jgi:hypothetical protein